MLSKMRPLIIDNNTKAQIKKIVDYAENHPVSLTYMEGVAKGENPPPGDNSNYRCMLCYLGKPGTGYSCVYTIDQSKTKQWMRHLSVAVDGDGSPQPIAIDMLMQEFGFRGRLCEDNGQIKKDSEISVYIEGEDDPDSSQAVNVVEYYDEEKEEDQGKEDQVQKGQVKDSS